MLDYTALKSTRLSHLGDHFVLVRLSQLH